MRTRTIDLELGERKAESGRKIFKAILSSEAAVRRRSWEDGEFDEVLSHREGAINLSRVPLPLLESHEQRTLPIGIVENVQLIGASLCGTVSFGTSARAQEVAADVEAGVIRNLSIGYAIEKTEETTQSGRKVMTATRWTPHEVSAVSVGRGHRRSL